MNGQPVGGMFETKPGMGLDHVPDCWFAYIVVDDIDARLEKGPVLRPEGPVTANKDRGPLRWWPPS